MVGGSPVRSVEEIRNTITHALDMGCAQETVDIYGHQVTYRLPTVKQLIEAKTLCHQYEGTEAYSLAYGTALWAACVQLVDGRPAFRALGRQDNSLQARWLQALDNLYPETLEKWLQAYSKLKTKADEELLHLGESSAATPIQK